MPTQLRGLTSPISGFLPGQVQGNWVGSYGSEGYCLCAWNSTSDLISMPLNTLALPKGGRFRWASGGSDKRALWNPQQNFRTAATYYNESAPLEVALTFKAPFTGYLSLYMIDWENEHLAQTVEVSTPLIAQSREASSFKAGVWQRYSIEAASSVTIEITEVAPSHKPVLSGIFLDPLHRGGSAVVKPAQLRGLTSSKMGASLTTFLVGSLHSEDANHNLAVGAPLTVLTTGEQNVAYGWEALHRVTTAKNNVAVGVKALNALQTAVNNVAVGLSALELTTTGAKNVAIGTAALAQNTIGASNTALGNGAMEKNTEGERNTAVGVQAMEFNTTGINNVAVGGSALEENTTGSKNVAIGVNALGGGELGSGNTGAINTAVGSGALERNKAGKANVAVGNQVLSQNTEASENTAVGNGALTAITTGAKNVALGAFAGEAAVTGKENTYLGFGAGAAMTGSGNVCLGYNAGNTGAGGSNELYIHNARATEPLILGEFPNAKLQLNASEIGFFKHAVGKQKAIVAEASAKALIEYLKELGLCG